MAGLSCTLVSVGSYHMVFLSRIPRHRQKLRSGFPPRELHPPLDVTQPVKLDNGEKVSVDILPPTPVEVEGRSLATLEGREEVSLESKETEKQQRTQQGREVL